MIVLGIDCATPVASVGLVASDDATVAVPEAAVGDRLLAERSLRAARDLAATVVPLVDEVLAAAGRRPGDVDLVAVSAGPGSFTGLRIGLSVAKGFALATGCAVVGVPTLEALAEVAAADRRGVICAILDARRGEVYGAAFRAAAGRAGQLARLRDETAASPEALAADLAKLAAAAPAGEGCVLLGDGVEAYRSIWESRLPDAELLPASQFHPRGGVVARLGRRRLAEIGADPADRLVPRYCRLAEAEQKRCGVLPAGDPGAR